VEPFTSHTGRIAVVPGDHIDTDRIIPARYLSRISRFGYGELLFSDMRGPDFALDQPEAVGADILVVGTNFGCGSSREHAVWAIQQAGFRSVIARRDAESPGYSDIFRSNAANCGLLLVELDPTAHAKLVALGSGAEATVDLEAMEVRANGETYPFDIDPGTRDALLKGLDLIGTTLQFLPEIDRYEQQRMAFVPSSSRESR
jgi:3-isopropylmalate/(R)-2-methylmalate dehydratase small subunit